MQETPGIHHPKISAKSVTTIVGVWGNTPINVLYAAFLFWPSIDYLDVKCKKEHEHE